MQRKVVAFQPCQSLGKVQPAQLNVIPDLSLLLRGGIEGVHKLIPIRSFDLSSSNLLCSRLINFELWVGLLEIKHLWGNSFQPFVCRT